jgi:hypothetical protein
LPQAPGKLRKPTKKAALSRVAFLRPFSLSEGYNLLTSFLTSPGAADGNLSPGNAHVKTRLLSNLNFDHSLSLVGDPEPLARNGLI